MNRKRIPEQRLENQAGDGLQHPHRQSESYRAHVRRKLAAYERHIQLGLIAQGLLQCLAVNFRRLVWFNFHSRIRAASPPKPPSEWVVSHALRHRWPQFLTGSPKSAILKKFLASKINLDRWGYATILGLDRGINVPLSSCRKISEELHCLLNSELMIIGPRTLAPSIFLARPPEELCFANTGSCRWLRERLGRRFDCFCCANSTVNSSQLAQAPETCAAAVAAEPGLVTAVADRHGLPQAASTETLPLLAWRTYRPTA